MKFISFIEDEEVIEKLLKHFTLWDFKARAPPKVKAPFLTIYLNDSKSQVLSPDSFYAYPDCPMDSYRIPKPDRVISLVTISIETVEKTL